MSPSLSAPDAICAGTLTLVARENEVDPITIKSKGNSMVRTELNTPRGTIVRILNRGVGAIISPNGSVHSLLLNNTFAERIAHIPSLSLLAESQGPKVKVEAQESVDTGGVVNDVFALAYTPDPSHEQAAMFLAMTKVVFFVNRETNLVSQVRFTRYSENGRARQMVERRFSDYRSVRGTAIPFRQETFVDGNLESVLILTSAELAVDLSDQEFAVPTEKKAVTQ